MENGGRKFWQRRRGQKLIPASVDSLCVLHPTMAKRSFPIYGGLAGLQRSLFDTMDLQVGHVLKYTNLEDSMLLSCSRAADTSNPTFPGVKWVSSRKYMQIVVKKKTFFFKIWGQTSHFCIKICYFCEYY